MSLNIVESINNEFWNYADAKRLSLFDNSMTPIKDGVLGGGGIPTKAFSPCGSIVVVMKTSYTSTTSFFEHAFFCKITFEPSFFKLLEKNIYIT
jgi:hypothetical protein